MKKKFNVDKYKMYKIIDKIPGFVVLLLMIFLAPLGVHLYVVRSKKRKVKIYNNSRTLIWVGIFILFLIGVGIYSKIKEIINLYSSGMSLDMIGFIPDNLWLYILGIIMCISYLVGAKKLLNQAKVEREYIKLINLNKESSLKKLSKELFESVDKIKENIRILQECGYLVPLEIDDKKNKIIYKEFKQQKIVTSGMKKNEKLNKIVQCPKCGAIVSLKFEEYVECDFCGYGLIEENNC